MRFHHLSSLCLTVILLSGCAVSLQAPLPAADPSSGLHTPFLGTWSVTELGGQVPGEPVEIRVVLDDAQNLVAVVPTASPPQSQEFHLVQLDGLIFAFAEDEQSGRWNVVQLVMDGSGQVVTIRGLDLSRVRQDIANGDLAGQIEEVDTDSDVLSIEATTDELAAYISADPTVFVDVAVVNRTE